MAPRSLSNLDDSIANESSYFFLSSRAAQNLLKYEYRGADHSLLYQYILSPLAAFCVHQMTPKWLAPNLITLLGLVFMVASYAFMWILNPSLSPDVDMPSWVFLYNGAAILIYQTLDNMDGKQARRTGSSSPLGLIFDHGCDAIDSLFGSTAWIIAMALDPDKDAWLCWIVLLGPYALFYIGTWEQYHTGELVLPIINGPNEGLLGAALMSFASCAYGTSVWQKTTISDHILSPLLEGMGIEAVELRNCDVLVLFSFFGFVQETTIKTVCVARKHGMRTLISLVPFIVLGGASLRFMVFEKEDTWLAAPRTILHLIATLFVDMVMDLMVAHTTRETFASNRLILVPLIYLTVRMTVHAWSPRLYLLVFYASAAFVFVVLRTAQLLQEIASVLNVWCFDVTTPRTPVEAAKKSS